MKRTLHATFTVDSWDEKPISEHRGASKMTHAVVTKTYAGDIEGSSDTEWLMSYADDGTATFVGLERISATLGDVHGSIVVQHVGTFAEGSAKATLTVVPGAASAGVGAVTGSGDFLADPAGAVTLHVRFPD